jgi:hypothetical protein
MVVYMRNDAKLAFMDDPLLSVSSIIPKSLLNKLVKNIFICV